LLAVNSGLALGDDLPPDHHIFRYIGGGSIHDDFIEPAAFRRKNKGGQLEAGLSVNWVEWFGTATPEEAVQPLCAVFRNKEYKVGATSRFALLNVATAKESASKYAPISILQYKQPKDESHSLVTAYPEALNDEIAEQLHKAMITSYLTTAK
jgi:hypothetical protein